MAYTIELALWDKSMSDDDINERAEDVSDIILQIRKDALPDLNYLATNGSCNMYVNEWAQELISWIPMKRKNLMTEWMKD